MKITVGGYHEYSIEWIATFTGLFLACVWWLCSFLFNSSQSAGVDFVPVIIVFLIGFSAVELLGAWEIYKLWRDENDALRAEAWRRYNQANWEAGQIGKGKVIESPVLDQGLETPRQIVIHHAGQTRTIDAVENWTPEQYEALNALQALFLWAAALGGITSPVLVGKGKPFTKAEHWGELTNFADEMGLVEKENGVATKLAVTSYAYAIGSIPRLLSRASVPDGWKAPTIPPPPPDAWDKVRRSERKGERSV